jgi:hypothetical protein
MYLKVAVGRRPAETGRWSSRHHFDHIAGGKAFKDAGHGDRAHAGERAPDAAQGPHTVIPDETVDKTRKHQSIEEHDHDHFKNSVYSSPWNDLAI